MKQIFILLWIFIVPLLVALWTLGCSIFGKDNKRQPLQKTNEELKPFKNLFLYLTDVVVCLAILFMLLGAPDIKGSLTIVFTFEVLLFDFCSAIFFLLATQWIIGISGIFFFKVHVETILTPLFESMWRDSFPTGLVIFCVILYPLASWFQFRQIAFPSNSGNLIMRKN